MQQTSRLHCKLRFSVFSQKSFLLKIMLLPLFVNYKLGIFTTFIISADQNKLHIRQHTKAALTAKFTFELIAKIGRVIVKEFHGIPVGETVRQIYKAAHKSVELI